MEKGMYVKDIKGGTAVSGVFVVAASSHARTQNGEPFWTLTLSDRSGSIDAKIWSPLSTRFTEIAIGSMVFICGNVAVYREKPQIAVKNFTPLTGKECSNLDLSKFVPTSAVAPEEMLMRLRALCISELTYAPWRDFVLSVLDNSEIQERLKAAPAAKNIHQAYRGGLLEHTLNVARLCLAFADLYPQLDRQTLLVGAILHDIGKIREYNCGIFIDFTQEGKLMGHIFLGLEILAPFFSASNVELSLQEHLKHLIISHHGELEYGSPRLPQTAEAFALHYADNLDARLALCGAQFDDKTKAPVWSQRLGFIERQILLPGHTPASDIDQQSASSAAPNFEEIPVEFYGDDWDNADYLEEAKTESRPREIRDPSRKGQGSFW